MIKSHMNITISNQTCVAFFTTITILLANYKLYKSPLYDAISLFLSVIVKGFSLDQPKRIWQNLKCEFHSNEWWMIESVHQRNMLLPLLVHTPPIALSNLLFFVV